LRAEHSECGLPYRSYLQAAYPARHVCYRALVVHSARWQDWAMTELPEEINTAVEAEIDAEIEVEA